MKITKSDINRWIKEGKISFYKVGLCMSLALGTGLTLYKVKSDFIEYHTNTDKTISYDIEGLSTRKELGKNDISKINEIKNVTKLCIYDDGSLDLDQIDGSKLPDNVEITIRGKEDEVIRLSEKRYGFLKNIKNIDKLILGNDVTIDSKYLESLTNIANLELYMSNRTNLNYKDMTYLKSLTLHGFPYDVAMFLDSKDLEELTKAGVDIKYNDIKSLIEINNKIDKIVESLDIDESSTDVEKINAAIEWILNNYSYDPKVSELLKEDKRDEIDHTPFYGLGTLYGGLENDTQICGNYAAMANTLMHRLGIETYYAKSGDHAWNIINYDGTYYHLDTTNLDDSEVIDLDASVYVLASSPDGRVMQFDPPVPYGYRIISYGTTCNAKKISVEEAFESKNQDEINLFKDDGYLTSVEDDNSYSNKMLFSPVDEDIMHYEKKDKVISKEEMIQVKFKQHVYLVYFSVAVLAALLNDLLAIKEIEEKEEKEKNLEKAL